MQKGMGGQALYNLLITTKINIGLALLEVVQIFHGLTARAGAIQILEQANRRTMVITEKLL